MSTSCREGVAVTNLFGSCLPANVLIFPWYLKDSFVGYRIYIGCFLVLLALWIYWLTFFWPPKFLTRNLLNILLRIFICDESLLSSWFQGSLFDFVFWKFDYNVYGLDLRELLLVELLAYLYSRLSSNMGSFSHYFHIYSFTPFSLWGLTMHTLVCFIVSHGSLSLCLVFFDHLSFSSPDSIISIVLSSSLQIHSFYSLNLSF